MLSNSRQHILILGLVDYLDHRADLGSKDTIMSAVNQNVAELQEMGIDSTIVGVEPDRFDTTVAELKTKLQERSWDAIVFGGAMRFTEFVPVLETLLYVTTVDIANKGSSPKFVFPKTPGDITEGVKRTLLA